MVNTSSSHSTGQTWVETTVKIDKWVYGGDGLATLDSGQKMMLPDVIPDETVRVSYQSKVKGLLRGRLTQVLEPSSQRIEPQCDVFGICGGCHWQHAQTPLQKLWKQRIVEETFLRIGKFQGLTVRPIFEADDELTFPEWSYREKVTWHIDDAFGSPQLGFIQRDSGSSVVSVMTCQIVPDVFNQIAQRLRDAVELLSMCKTIQCRKDTQGHVMLIFEPRDPDRHAPHPERYSKWLRGFKEQVDTIDRLSWPVHSWVVLSGQWDDAWEGSKNTAFKVLWGQEHLHYQLGDDRFQVSPTSFFQVQPVLARAMMIWIAEQLTSASDCAQADGNMLDLYGGVGLFSIGLAHCVSGGIDLVESMHSSIRDAWNNVQAHGLADRIQCLEQSVEQFVSGNGSYYDLAIVDPPRAGCSGEVVDWLSQHIQKKLVYVSCDPTTLARDCRRLCDQGWQIDIIQPFDMFAQTYHIEVIVILSKNEPTNVGSSEDTMSGSD